MSYYQQKRKAYNDIDELFKDNKSQDAIIFVIANKYGFGELFVKKRLELLKRLTNEE